MVLPLPHPPPLYHPNGKTSYSFFNQIKPIKIMKKVSLVFALVLGFAATSFAQPSSKCANGLAESHYPDPNHVILYTTPIDLYGIKNSDGDPAYSVTLRADYKNNVANNVYLIENQTGKKWYMSQVTLVGNDMPGICDRKKGADLSNTRMYRSPLTNAVVYISVWGEENPYVGHQKAYLFVYRPDFKLSL